MPTAQTFEDLMAILDYPMFIVTARDGGERSGCLVGFATQASIHPPRFLIAISEKNHTFKLALAVRHLAVHFVPQSAPELAELFGGETGDEVDKFARCAWRDGPEGTPILDDCANWFVGRVLDRFDLGDHCGHLLEPVAAARGSDVEPFAFHRARVIDPGHAP
jgi:flavin reductase (DIM6/NTAB) family NADH-FMN oxidoreductase RutF